MTPIVSVQELMHDVLQPVADTLFTSVRIVVDRGGTVEEGPETDADWENLRSAAVTLAEGVYLLKVPRPIVPQEDDRVRDATELTPAQILEKLQRDPVLWDARIQTVRNAALQAIDVIERRDTEELWDVGENLYIACQNCHYDYWYPAQRELLKSLEEKVRQFNLESATP
jgi:hypothetical protein